MEKLTPKQKLIVRKMQDGYIMMLGVDDFSGRHYYLITKGYDNIYFRSNVFGSLLEKKMIYQQMSWPFDYVLTQKGEQF